MKPLQQVYWLGPQRCSTTNATRLDTGQSLKRWLNDFGSTATQATRSLGLKTLCTGPQAPQTRGQTSAAPPSKPQASTEQTASTPAPPQSICRRTASSVFIELRDQIFGDVLADVLGNLFRMAITSSRSFDLPILDIPKRIRAAQNLLHHHTGTLTDGHMPEAPEHVVVNEALTTPSNMHMQVIRVRGMTL